ncbi:hypothetical protein ES703_25448 [subsurface metagenome]
MSEINKAMDVAELNIKPPIEGKTRLSEDMQQTLALLTAMGADKRRPIRCSESGILNVTDPRIKDIKHYIRTALKDPKAGDDISCTAVMAMGHPSNTDLIWVRPNGIAYASNSWPLAAGEVVGFTLDNLSQLKMLIAAENDRLIVAYTR